MRLTSRVMPCFERSPSPAGRCPSYSTIPLAKLGRMGWVKRRRNSQYYWNKTRIKAVHNRRLWFFLCIFANSAPRLLKCTQSLISSGPLFVCDNSHVQHIYIQCVETTLIISSHKSSEIVCCPSHKHPRYWVILKWKCLDMFYAHCFSTCGRHDVCQIKWSHIYCNVLQVVEVKWEKNSHVL